MSWRTGSAGRRADRPGPRGRELRRDEAAPLRLVPDRVTPFGQQIFKQLLLGEQLTVPPGPDDRMEESALFRPLGNGMAVDREHVAVVPPPPPQGDREVKGMATEPVDRVVLRQIRVVPDLPGRVIYNVRVGEDFELGP